MISIFITLTHSEGVLLRDLHAVAMGRLEIAFGRLRLERPGMVASGIMDETGDSMVRMIKSGAGAVVTKSIGLAPRPGHKNPTFTEV
jgi:dihydroorotate dehydrogenase (NAD+) catalytic subunit